MSNSRIAQLVGNGALNPTGAGSSPAPAAIYFDRRLNRWEPIQYPWETPRDFMAEYDEIFARWGTGKFRQMKVRLRYVGRTTPRIHCPEVEYDD